MPLHEFPGLDKFQIENAIRVLHPTASPSTMMFVKRAGKPWAIGDWHNDFPVPTLAEVQAAMQTDSYMELVGLKTNRVAREAAYPALQDQLGAITKVLAALDDAGVIPDCPARDELRDLLGKIASVKAKFPVPPAASWRVVQKDKYRPAKDQDRSKSA